MLLLIATLLTGTAHSSPQKELSIQNAGSIFYPIKIASTTFFEYGAESGVLQPPWDHAGPGGEGEKSVSKAFVVSTPVRTGSKSVELYVKPPPNSDAQRRVGLAYANTAKEFYSGWWAYFPSGQGWEDPDVNGWGTTIGGMQPFWGPDGVNKWKYYTSARFAWSQNDRRLLFVYSFPYDPSQNEEWDTNYYVGDYLDTWVHFEVYLKWTNDTSGVVRAWFNDNLVAEKTGLKSDPTGYSEFVEENCVFAYGYPYPTIRIELYQSQNSPEHWYFIDDVVGGTERVSQTHGIYDDYY